MKKYLLVPFLLAICGVAYSKTVTRFVIDDGMTTAHRNPSAAVDSSGNVHIVAQGRPADSINTTSDDIYYFRISRSGTLLTPALGITTGGAVHDNGRAHVAALSDGKAVVAWREHNPHVVKAVIVDPAGNSGAGAIVAGPVTVMDATTDSPQHFDVAVDGTHVQFVINASSNVWHARLAAADLSSEVAAHQVTGLTSYWQDVKVAVDGGGNLHVADRSSTTGYPYYAELDTDGNVLIGQTILHDDGSGTTGTYGNHLAIAMKGDRVRLLYGDKRNTVDATCQQCNEGQGGTAYLMTLDPSLNTQTAGSPGDITEMEVGSEVQVANTWYFQGFQSSDGTFHVMSGSGSKGTGDINYYRVKGSGVAYSHVTANNDAYSYYRKYIVGAGNMVVWAEGVFAPTLSGGTTQLVAAKTSSFIAPPSGDSGGAPAPVLLVILGLAGLLRARMRR